MTTHDAAFDEARWKEPRPTKWQEYVTWIAAGSPEDFIIKPLPEMELLALTKEEHEASRGFEPSAEQMHYIRTGLATPFPKLLPSESPMHAGIRDTLRKVNEPPGSWEARYMELVGEWKAFKAGKVQLEHPTREQRMASWAQAGKPGEYVQKIYRDELGRLLGVSTFTPEELQAKEELREALRTELAGLRTIRIRKGENIPATLRVGGIGEHLDRRRELEDAIATGVNR